ncbi:MAG: alanine--tRNA ligase [Puniceicoccales bacterium]|nr:alanine--tRNA ligase [Puniceicoccales bacterium]
MFLDAKFSDKEIKEHIVSGNRKDNFWMMGETGPCGPCTELHIDLTPKGDTAGKMVNTGTSQCIEIWNLVFIQYNANPDGTFSPLPARHVDTGMGFERVTSILQCTKNFKDFSGIISNYETDIFRPIFDVLEKQSGKQYTSTLPKSGSQGDTEQEKIDVAFRVIADHLRTLSFAIADGIQPGNNNRNYVLRRILRRAVKYGRTLGFKEPFFYKLVDVLVNSMGDIFPEIRTRQNHVKDVIRIEEEAFNKTLDRGIELFNNATSALEAYKRDWSSSEETQVGRASVSRTGKSLAPHFTGKDKPKGFINPDNDILREPEITIKPGSELPAHFAFKLYDTYGFPLDLTELLARERGLTVDTKGFEKLMEEQRERAKAAQKREVISLSEIKTKDATKFLGFKKFHTKAKVKEVVALKDKTALILGQSVFYAEMGGQVGDSGIISIGADTWRIATTRKSGDTFLHLIDGTDDAPTVGSLVQLEIDLDRRRAIERHHTVTHLLHWALHEVVSRDISQKGSFVNEEKLTFDFNSGPLTHQQIVEIERLVNTRILENAPVSWTEKSYEKIKNRSDVMQFFGDKYGDKVRVVQIGGTPGKLDGYSMELCGGTHVRSTGEIGCFRIVSEGAIAAGVRRIEAVAGLVAYQAARDEADKVASLAQKASVAPHDLLRRIEQYIEQTSTMEKRIRAYQQKENAIIANEFSARAKVVNGLRFIVGKLSTESPNVLRDIANESSGKADVIVFGGTFGEKVSIVCQCSPAAIKAGYQAGKIVSELCAALGGKGGGKPESAMGGGTNAAELGNVLLAYDQKIG